MLLAPELPWGQAMGLAEATGKVRFISKPAAVRNGADHLRATL